MRKILLPALLFILYGVAHAQRVEADVDFCNFSLPEDTKHAHASFSFNVAFLVDQNGKPADIKFIRRPEPGMGVVEAEVVECIMGWTIKNVPAKTRVVAYWHWEHGSGWDEFWVSGRGFSYRMRASGNKCPYARRSD